MVLLLRVILAVLGGVAGYQLVSLGLGQTSLSDVTNILLISLAVLTGGLVGAVLGGLLGRQVVRMSSGLDRATAKISGAALVVTSVGLLLGLAVGALGSLAVKDLPVVGVFLPPVIVALTAYIFSYLAYRRHGDISRMLGVRSREVEEREDHPAGKILDTSAIIDGRIGDIVPTHFIEGDIVIPEFVLEELQSIADSAEPLKRARGRRGLETVRSLQAAYDRVVITDRDYPNLTEVDAKLLKLAKDIGASIVTTDYNLNKIAQIQGVDVLNVNMLANALKPVVLPGESLAVHVIREGKEQDQGVAYLDDGTMVVVEGGRRMMGQDVEVEVTSVLQNPSGKMVFSKLAS